MGNLREELGQRVRALRQAAGLSQPKLAVRAGMDYKYLGGVERGQRNITVDNLERIVMALGIKPHQLWVTNPSGSQPLQINEADLSMAQDLMRKLDKQTRAAFITLIKQFVGLSVKRGKKTVKRP